jgi:hypothetical protein
MKPEPIEMLRFEQARHCDDLSFRLLKEYGI